MLRHLATWKPGHTKIHHPLTTESHTHTHREPQAATYGDCVDGVGVAIVVAVVVVLAPIAAGYHKDAPKALAASHHPMLQGSLKSKNTRGSLEKLTDLYLPYQLSSPPFLERKGKKPTGTGHGRKRFKDGLKKGRKLLVDQLFDGSTLLIRNGGARNGEPSTKSKGSDLRALFHFSLRTCASHTPPSR